MLLHHIFIESAKKYSKRMAIIDRSTGKRLTYSQALIGSLVFAEKLKKYQEGFIGIMVPTSAGAALAKLGTIMSGKIPVMINYSTGAASNAEYAQKKCGFKTIITSRALVEKIGCRIIPGMTFIEDIAESISSLDKVKAAAKSKLPLSLLLKSVHQGEEDDTAVILFTSGSESEPKAVELTHKNIGSNTVSCVEHFEASEEDIFMSMLPLFHVFGLTTNFWCPIFLGASLVTHGNPLEYRSIVKAIKEEKTTFLVATPTFLGGYLKLSKTGDFSALRIVVAGADKMPTWLRSEYLNKHNLDVYEGYGTTETSPVISANTPGKIKPGSIGTILPGVQVKITDLKTDEEVMPNQEGKIMVKGNLVMKGYFDDVEATSLRIKNGWYDTGDMGKIDEDGFLWHCGRLKRFIKIGGEMISLVKVEQELEKIISDETECCVVDIPDAVKGANIAVAITEKINEKEVLEQLAKNLPRIAIPKQFFVISELPKMGSGKIDFRQTNELVRALIQAKG